MAVLVEQIRQFHFWETVTLTFMINWDMKRFIPLVFIILLSCSLERELVKGNWIIFEGIYLNKNIEFKSTDLLQVANANGYIHANLDFFEDGSVILPGISCSNIRAQWKIIDKRLIMVIDSAHYNNSYGSEKDYASAEYSLLMKLDSLDKSDTAKQRMGREFQQMNPLLTHEFDAAMDIYGNSFQISIDGDNLFLKSETTCLKAQKDRTIDRLFEGL